MLRALGLFGIGTTLTVGTALIPGASSTPIQPPGAIAVWATDRDAHQVYGLDLDLILARSIPLGWPLEVEACDSGGAWVLRSGNAGTLTGHRLDRLSRAGELITEVTIHHALDLDTFQGEDALVIETPGGSHATTRVLRFHKEGSLFSLLEQAGLVCVAGSRDSVLAGTDSGAVLRIDPAPSGSVGVILAQVQLGGRIGDLARGPWPGSAWALDTSAARRLFLLDADLSVRWVANVGIAALHIAAVPGEERVWLADTATPRVRRFGPAGALEIDRRGLPLIGLDRAVAWREGGVLVAAPGAILHLDANGQTAPGQGGFNYLIDLARAGK